MPPTLIRNALLLILLAAAVPASAQNWTTPALGTSEDILALEQASFSDVWLVGRNGLVAQSSFDRTTWTIENIGTAADLYGIARQTSTQVWVAGTGGTVFVHPINDWDQVNVPNGSERFVLYSRGSGAVHAVGSGGSIYRTLNFGQDWTPQASGTTESLNHGAGFQTSSSWIVGDNGTILHTTNGGATWTPQISGTNENLNAILQAGVWLVVAGDNGTILRSNDSGMTWSKATTKVTANLNALAPSAFNASFFMACGDDGMLLKTSDYGVTWCAIDTETNVNLNAVRWLGISEVIIAGDGGFIRRSANTGGECVEPTAVGPMQSSSFAMRGPYPQPSFGSSAVSLSVSRTQKVEVAAYDLRGRRVATLHDGAVEGGSTIELHIDSRDWPAGMYFVRAAGEEFVETRKVSVLR